MKLSPDEFEEIVGVARNYLQASASEPLPIARLARNFAEVIVKLADHCVVGLPCALHGDGIHGQEAEELRSGVELILKNTDDVRDDEAAFVLAEQRKALIFLLDRIDARDSLAFREATDRPEAATSST
jgi:hypothetical protein